MSSACFRTPRADYENYGVVVRNESRASFCASTRSRRRAHTRRSPPAIAAPTSSPSAVFDYQPAKSKRAARLRSPTSSRQCRARSCGGGGGFALLAAHRRSGGAGCGAVRRCGALDTGSADPHPPAPSPIKTAEDRTGLTQSYCWGATLDFKSMSHGEKL